MVDASSLDGPMFDRVPTRARSVLVRVLDGIRCDPGGQARAFFGPPSRRVPIEWGRPIEPWQAKFVLEDIVGCRNFGRDEKLAWEFALSVDGVAMTLAFQKFGLRGYVDVQLDESQAAQLVDRLITAISGAMPLLEKTVLTDIADVQVAAGNVNIDNHYTDLHAQYDHFKRLAEASLVAGGRVEPVRETHSGEFGPVLSVRLPSGQLSQEARFESKAAAHAFFSLLEHVLLIGFLLSGDDASDGKLSTFIGSGWNAKFKRVVDLQDRRSKRYFDRLVAVHDEFRNPSAHGEVDADGTDFSFILPGVGPVPARLVVGRARERTYRWRARATADVLAELSEIDGWLGTGPLAAAVVYGESQLPLFFGGHAHGELAAIQGDLGALEDLIGRLSWLIDQSANMDW